MCYTRNVTTQTDVKNMLWASTAPAPSRAALIQVIQNVYTKRKWVTIITDDDMAVNGRVLRYDACMMDVSGYVAGCMATSLVPLAKIVAIYE